MALIKNLGRHRRGALAGWFQQGGSALAALLAVPLLNQTLGAETTGVWLAFQAIASIANLADFGFGYVTARQIAFSLGGGGADAVSPDIDTSATGWQGAANTLAVARRLNAICCCVAVAVLVGIGAALLNRQPVQVVAPRELLHTWVLLSCSFIITLLAKPYTAFLEGSGSFATSRVINGAQVLLGSLLSVAVVLVGGSLRSMAAGTALIAAGALVVQMRLVSRRMRVEKVSGVSPTTRSMRRMAGVAFPVGAVNTGGYLFGAVQVPLIALYISPAAVPAFYLAQRCGQFAISMILQMTFPQLPTFSQLLGTRNYTDALSTMRRAIRRTSFIVVVSMIVFAAAFPWISTELFRVEPLAMSLIALMAADYCIAACSVVWVHFVLASGTNPFLVATIASGVLNLVFIHLLIPSFGMFGVVMASLLSGALTTYWFNIVHGRRLMVKLKALTQSCPAALAEVT